LALSPNTPFVVGANDGVLSNLGVDAIQPGEVAVTIGTSGAMRAVVGRPRTDPDGRTFCYLLTDEHWVVGGPVNNGGIAFRWVRDELAAAETERAKRLGIDPYDVLTRIAERGPLRVWGAYLSSLPDGRTGTLVERRHACFLFRPCRTPPQGAHDPRRSGRRHLQLVQHSAGD
jgi:sugar (pentulose or hexulose) kinase